MHYELNRIKKIIYELENNQYKELKGKALQEIIDLVEKIKKDMKINEGAAVKNLNIQLSKISEEEFLYKPILTKNYYEGDYLERFGESRTLDLKSCHAFEKHNKFWQAHEVLGGNIFATIPAALLDKFQSNKLEGLGWNTVNVDIYEIKKTGGDRKELFKYIQYSFPYYIIIREVYGNIQMVLHYKLWYDVV